MVNGQFVNGYRGSIYRLTQELTSYETWSLSDLEHRANKIKDKLFSLYPFPTTRFKPLPKPVEEISLEDEDFNPTNRSLVGYTLFGEEHQQTYWVDMLIDVVKEIYRRYPDDLETLAQKDMWVHHVIGEEQKEFVKIHDGVYLWKNANNRNKLTGLRYIFDELDIAHAELTLYLDPQSVSVPSDNALPQDAENG